MLKMREYEQPDSETSGLTPFERKVYQFIMNSGEILTSNVPPRMRGAVPNLVDKGLVEVYRKRTSLWSSKKRKFLRAKYHDNEETSLASEA